MQGVEAGAVVQVQIEQDDIEAAARERRGGGDSSRMNAA
jgi:hypothetical protein